MNPYCGTELAAKPNWLWKLWQLRKAHCKRELLGERSKKKVIFDEQQRGGKLGSIYWKMHNRRNFWTCTTVGRSLKDGKLTKTPTRLSFSSEVGNIDFRFSYNIITDFKTVRWNEAYNMVLKISCNWFLVVHGILLTFTCLNTVNFLPFVIVKTCGCCKRFVTWFTMNRFFLKMSSLVNL